MSNTLNTVYNNYLSTYTPKTLTRFDAHKKSELRNVYSSIVKLNKEAPWYLPTNNPETQQYAVCLKENARGLYNSIAQLGGLDSATLFSKKSAYSSAPDILTATYIGSDAHEASAPELEIEVHALATRQKNMGLFLPADDSTGFTPDTYSFDIGIGGTNYEFQFSIAEHETNRSVQERLVRLINNSGIGINATIYESEGNTALCITSDSTGLPIGKNDIFTISDINTSQKAGTVEYFGIDYVSNKAANALFTINGEERSTSSNHFTIGNLYDIEINSLTGEGKAVQVGLKPDIESLTDNISLLIGSYNEFIKATAVYSESQNKSRQLVREMSSIASLYGSSLEENGISMTADGTLSINEQSLRNSATHSEDINETFGYLKNFAASLIRKTTQVSMNPMDYVNRTIVAYKNPGKNFTSPYTPSAYSGMMFNGYC